MNTKRYMTVLMALFVAIFAAACGGAAETVAEPEAAAEESEAMEETMDEGEMEEEAMEDDAMDEDAMEEHGDDEAHSDDAMEEEAMEDMGTIVDIAVADENFSTLVGALVATGLDQVVAGEGPFTVLAPTNAAFEALPEGLLESLTEEQLSAVLTYHVIAGSVPAETVVGLESASTVQGEDITIAVDGDTVMINDAAVTATDIKGSNGIIHVIDTVLIPPSFQDAAMEEEAMEDMGTIVDIAVADENFSTLVGALVATGLDQVVAGEGPFTVLAPTNAAFEALPEGLLESLTEEQLSAVLTYHVIAGSVPAETVVGLESASTVQGEDITIAVDGDTVMINNATVTATDIMGSNGIIHVIDSVLIPPSFQDAAAEDSAMADDAMADMGTIVDIAAADENFSTLVGALVATGLDQVVAGEGPFTVLAPTNAAFEALPEGLLESLTEEQLTAVLTYHVIAGSAPAETVVGLESATTVQGEDIAITVDGDHVMINTANVTATDIKGSNGIIHVIDAVLIPPSLQP